MQTDWSLVLQIVTLIGIFLAWITLYGNYRAGRATSESKMGEMGTDLAAVGVDLKEVKNEVRQIRERLIRVEVKVGIDAQ